MCCIQGFMMGAVKEHSISHSPWEWGGQDVDNNNIEVDREEHCEKSPCSLHFFPLQVWEVVRISRRLSQLTLSLANRSTSSTCLIESARGFSSFSPKPCQPASTWYAHDCTLVFWCKRVLLLDGLLTPCSIRDADTWPASQPATATAATKKKKPPTYSSFSTFKCRFQNPGKKRRHSFDKTVHLAGTVHSTRRHLLCVPCRNAGRTCHMINSTLSKPGAGSRSKSKLLFQRLQI